MPLHYFLRYESEDSFCTIAGGLYTLRHVSPVIVNHMQTATDTLLQ